MDKQTAIRTGVAGAVAAAGLTVGGLAMANAATDEPSTTQSAPDKNDRPGGPGHGGPGRAFGDTAAFAKALGVSEDKLTAALKAIREDQPKSSDKTDEKSDGERPDPAARQAALATALAKELGISEAKVTQALKDVRAVEKSDRRAELSTRLDQAVKAGDLTATDKASVLKAFDAGVLGGGSR